MTSTWPGWITAVESANPFVSRSALRVTSWAAAMPYKLSPEAMT
jgi:hypothetical protein